MKANRKFRGEDEAVSPVIAVILMVAITVVLAATVYVWVSGFGNQGNQPAKTIALSSAGAYHATNDYKDYTVASAAPGMKYDDVDFTLNGVAIACEFVDATTAPTGTAAAPVFGIMRGGAWVDCASTTLAITAGDTLRFDSDASFSGQALRVLDSQANSVILTLTIG